MEDQILCVTSAIKDHALHALGPDKGPVFLTHRRGEWAPLLKCEVVNIGLQSEEYGVHSLRRSAVAVLHGLVSHYKIRRNGHGGLIFVGSTGLSGPTVFHVFCSIYY